MIFGAEFDCLSALDQASFDDQEEGGCGWVTIAEVASAWERSYAWASEILAALYRGGYAERRRSSARLRYAVSELGGAELLAEDTTA